MGLKNEIKSALPEMFGEFGESATWNGNIYNCIVSEGQNAVELETGGFVPDGNFIIKFLESDLNGVYPRCGQIVTYNDNLYRIVWVSNRKGHGQFAVQVMPKEK